ncbi:dUTP pyrophosphatase [Enteropsectra breve]|nr:dUTP pyrophosphatase [Enteropsectra breve]
MSIVKIRPAESGSILPKANGCGSYILFANEDVVMVPNVINKLPVGFSMSFPATYGTLITRFSNKLKVLGGLVDSDYRGELAVLGSVENEMSVKKGEPIAMMSVVEIGLPAIEELSDELEDDSSSESE